MQVPLPTDIFKCKNLGAKHIQFVRSIPSDAIISNNNNNNLYFKNKKLNK